MCAYPFSQREIYNTEDVKKVLDSACYYAYLGTARLIKLATVDDPIRVYFNAACSVWSLCTALCKINSVAWSDFNSTAEQTLTAVEDVYGEFQWFKMLRQNTDTIETLYKLYNREIDTISIPEETINIIFQAVLNACSYLDIKRAEDNRPPSLVSLAEAGLL